MAYDFSPVTHDSDALSRISDLLVRTFPQAPKYRSTAYLAWQYRENPAGAAVGVNAFAGDTLAAHYVTIPIVAWFEGTERRGLLSLNTATHPEHQGKGLFTQLADRTYQLGAEQGYEFVVGVANANSTPGFLRKLGFQLVAPLDADIGIGRVVSDAERAGKQFGVCWNDQRFRWRLANPEAHYSGSVRADRVDILAPTHLPGIQACLGALPKECVPQSQLNRRLWRPLTLWIGLDRQRRKSGLFVSLPDRLKSSPLNLIFRDLVSNRQLNSPDSVFRLLDFDAY